MILVLVLLVALALVPLGGGSLRRLSSVRLRSPWLLWLALGALVVLMVFPGPETGWRTALNMAVYPLGLAWVWMNRHLPGMWIVGLGAACNLAAILANGGVMPASARALEIAGISTDPDLFANSAVLADPRLLFLGDVIPTPSWLPSANVISVGDVLIVLGVAYGIHRLTGSRLAGRPRPPEGSPADAR
ncbi:MAG TPA: DUF5317 domain-containing protein [Actinomycetota bacterium]|nr:DUF5317 domain-containing protein [Actinomycetota bacterium]